MKPWLVSEDGKPNQVIYFLASMSAADVVASLKQYNKCGESVTVSENIQ